MEDNIISKWIFKYGNEIVRKKTEEKIERLMKNIHVLPSRFPKGIHLLDYHITSAEKPKEGDWYITPNNTVLKALGIMLINVEDYKKIILTTDQDLIADGVQAIDNDFLEWFVKNPSCERVEVELEAMFKGYMTFPESINDSPFHGNLKYKIIIPKEEPKQERVCNCGLKESEHNVRHPFVPKQETIKEAAERLSDLQEGTYTVQHKITYQHGFVDGAKEQAKRMYSEEEVLNFTQTMIMQYKFGNTNIEQLDLLKESLEQFKKK